MQDRARLALGVGVGYLLGRTRKMRLAMALAAVGATGARSSRDLVQRGLKQLGSSVELGKLTDVTRGQLVDAVKTAAATAASSRIDALNERLRGTSVDEEPGSEHDEEDEAPAARKSTPDRADEGTHEDEPVDTEQDGADEPEPPRRRAATRATGRRRAGSDAADAEPRRRSTARSRTGRAPVRRAGR